MPLVCCSGQQQFHLHVASIHIVRLWRDVAGAQRLIDGGQHRDISDRRIGRLDMGNHVRLLVWQVSVTWNS